VNGRRDAMSLTIHSKYLNNIDVISNVQSCITTNLAWLELKRLFQSQNVITKMYLKDKFHILKMRKNEYRVKAW
jgi:hypothetical protein